MFVTELGLYSCILASVYDSLSVLREMVAVLGTVTQNKLKE